MADIAVSTLSQEELVVPVAVVRAGVTGDPTTDPVSVAVVAQDGEPGSSSWQPAEWESAGAGAGWQARFAIGPGSLIGTLAAGYYWVWVRVVDSTETPVKRAANRILVY